MKKYLTRGASIMASLVVAAGTIGAATPVFANPTTGEAQGKITVTNVKEEGAVVKAYQIVDGTYADGKLTGFTLVDGTNMKIADIEKPTSDEITAIADYLQAHSEIAGIDLSADGNVSYSATVDAGEYVVIVTKAGATVYNPAVVSVNVTDANDLTMVTDGAVDIASRFSAGDTAYLKSSSSTMDKNIVGSSEANEKGDTVAVGDTVNFEIVDMTFPSYSKDYKEGSVFYRISDKLDTEAFDVIDFGGLKVLVDNVEVAASADTYTLTKDADEKGFVIEFADAYIRANEGKAVKVIYSSKLAAGAGVNFAENKNIAKIAYANDPTKDTGYDEATNPGYEEQKVTYHYTFGIDADIDAQGSDTVNKETHEFNKVTIAGENYIAATSTITSSTTMKSLEALAGAEFTLYSDATVSKAAWDEPVYGERYICNYCGEAFSTDIDNEDIDNHITSGTCNGASYHLDIHFQIGTIHHDAVTGSLTGELAKATSDENGHVRFTREPTI